jgi:hypothetical protein
MAGTLDSKLIDLKTSLEEKIHPSPPLVLQKNSILRTIQENQ